MYEQAARQSKILPEHIPLPVYALGAGRRDHEEGTEGGVSSLISDYVGMTFCLQGRGVAYLFDRAFLLEKNDLIFYYPNEDHRFKPETADCVNAWINFDGPLAMAVLASYRFPRRLSMRREFPEELYRELFHCLPDPAATSVRHASTLIFQILEYVAGGGASLTGGDSGETIDRMVKYIDANLSNPDLNVNGLCEIFDLHRSTCRKKFVEKMFIPPGEYIRNQRLSQARKLLSGTDLPIQEIGRQCGFPEKTSFSRFFKSFRDSMPPGEYRRKYRSYNGK